MRECPTGRVRRTAHLRTGPRAVRRPTRYRADRLSHGIRRCSSWPPPLASVAWFSGRPRRTEDVRVHTTHSQICRPTQTAPTSSSLPRGTKPLPDNGFGPGRPVPAGGLLSAILRAQERSSPTDPPGTVPAGQRITQWYSLFPFSTVPRGGDSGLVISWRRRRVGQHTIPIEDRCRTPTAQFMHPRFRITENVPDDPAAGHQSVGDDEPMHRQGIGSPHRSATRFSAASAISRSIPCRYSGVIV